jgi:hypothetical protein
MLTEPPPARLLKFETGQRGLRSNILIGHSSGYERAYHHVEQVESKA